MELDPQKKRAKKSWVHSGRTFWKIFFFQVTIFAWKFWTLTLKNMQHSFLNPFTHHIASEFYRPFFTKKLVNALFFSVSHKGWPRSSIVMTMIRKTSKYFQKSPKKRVSKMETQLVSIICKFYFISLLKSIRIFGHGPSKKKS